MLAAKLNHSILSRKQKAHGLSWRNLLIRTYQGWGKGSLDSTLAFELRVKHTLESETYQFP